MNSVPYTSILQFNIIKELIAAVEEEELISDSESRVIVIMHESNLGDAIARFTPVGPVLY